MRGCSDRGRAVRPSPLSGNTEYDIFDNYVLIIINYFYRTIFIGYCFEETSDNSSCRSPDEVRPAAMKCTAYARHSLSTVDSVMFMNALKYILLLKNY